MAIQIGQFTINGFGRPRIEGIFTDRSQGATRAVPSRVCVIGYTTMGEPYKPVAIDSWASFVENFGGLSDDSDFPFYCKRALDLGGKLYVVRVAHWTGTAWQGTKASATITSAPNSITFTAKFVGTGYNGIKIEIRNAKSKDTTKVDVIETYNGKQNTVYNVAKTGASVDGIALNNGLKYTFVNTFPTTLPIGTATLASGAQTFASVVDADYTGDSETETKGLFAFDNIFDSMRIANMDRANPTVDAAMIAYCEQRGNMRCLLQVPFADAGNWQDMTDYRNGTGAYSHDAYDTMFGSITAGNVVIKDTAALGGTTEIRSIGDLVGMISTKDFNSGVGKTLAGPNRGILKNVLGVAYNLAQPNRKDDWDFVYDNGVNPVIDTDLLNSEGVSVLQTALFGNRSLLLDQDTFLRYDHVCDILVWLRWKIVPIMKSFIDEPNVQPTWRAIYDKVKPVILEAVANGWIYGGEDEFWQWQGDQNAKTFNDLEVNNQTDINARIYRARLVITAIPVIEYIGLEFINTTTETVANFIIPA